ncbi:MAG: tRNA pseudouridine(55) synthase TruB [Puniceicoccaceae bacterium]|nr:MAG: tRNA pseudouridine(55) synthase TruB [Puniceicoccaceae bacterium]
MVEKNEYEGVLLIDKPVGITSHDVVDRVRRILRMKRIGHAGTLDPLATGLLIILVGKATKLSQYLMSLDKEYEGTITLGATTDSQDADGEVLSRRPVPELAPADLQTAMNGFVGDQYQTPPMHSAIKVAGVPLYKMARKGKTIEREPRFIRIASFSLHQFQTPELTFSLRCSKGTYVRTIAHDLGEKLGCGGHLSALRRTASDRFHVRDAVTLETLGSLDEAGIRDRLIAPHDAAPSLVL